MKRESWSYKVFADLTLDRQEIAVLSRTAEAHYDALCRAASVPGPGAFLNGYRNTLDEEKGTATCSLDQRQVDTLIKILEMVRYLPEDEARVGTDLQYELRGLLYAMSVERERVCLSASGVGLKQEAR